VTEPSDFGTSPKPKQTPRGAVAMGLSLPRTDRIARDAQQRSFTAIWLALGALVLSGTALAALVMGAWR